jgi:hypothetical protein
MKNSHAPFQILISFFAFVACAPCSTWSQTSPSPNCGPLAAPPPEATFGGPSTAGAGQTELGVAVGTYGEFYPSPSCGHVGTTDWLVRWRRGIGDRFDLGFDGEVDTQGGTNGGTIKVAARYQVTQGFRVEGGVGTSDTGFAGRSINADVAGVIGTTRENSTWNYYSSLRLAASHGCNGLFCASADTNGNHNPGAIFLVGAIGATARVSDHAKFVMEAADGEAFSRELPDPERVGSVHFTIGILFNVGKRP